MKTSPKPQDVQARTLGEFIRDRRKQMGLSLREFAKKAEISPAFMSQIELDRAFPSAEMLERISRALGVPAVQLKLLDTRVPLDELRRLLDKSPELRSALLALIGLVKRDQRKLAGIAEQIAAVIRHSSS